MVSELVKVFDLEGSGEKMNPLLRSFSLEKRKQRRGFEVYYTPPSAFSRRRENVKRGRRILKMWERKEVLRLRFVLGLSQKQIAQSLGTVWDILRRAQEASLTWERVERLTEKELGELLYGHEVGNSRSGDSPVPDWSYIHTELRKKGVTLTLLWFEYKQKYPQGYSESLLCELYRTWLGKQEVCMRQIHKAGSSGISQEKVPLWWIQKRERTSAKSFSWLCSGPQDSFTQRPLNPKIFGAAQSHTNALEYFHGAPEITVPDCTKTAVKKACYWEPELNRTYKDWAEYYSTCVIPARPRRAKDKAKVESAVKVAQTWILARLRNRRFFTLWELNRAIWELVEEIKARPLKVLGISRRTRPNRP